MEQWQVADDKQKARYDRMQGSGSMQDRCCQVSIVNLGARHSSLKGAVHEGTDWQPSSPLFVPLHIHPMRLQQEGQNKL